MLLKKIVIVLVIANLGYAAYSQGWLNTFTGADNTEREPDRLKRQINPLSVEVKPDAALEPPVTAPPEAPSNTNNDNGNDAPAPCTATSPLQEQWNLYMGLYDTTAKRDAKMMALAKLNIAAQPVTKPSLKIGFSIGSYSDEVSARQALQTLTPKGVSTAKILLWQAHVTCH